LKIAIEIVDLPINSMVIFHSYVKLPEGIYIYIYIHNPPKSLQKTVNFEKCMLLAAEAAEDLSFRTGSKGRFTGNRTSIFGATIAMVSA